MTTLLLRLTGPLQAWGTESRFEVRGTGTEPSKSGVAGLLAAALGRPRSGPVDDLAGLRMGVRVDRPGVVQVDFHTAENVARVPGKEADRKYPVVSRRAYLADADFLVGLEGDVELLARLDAALAAPRWPLFLGRKSCPPSLPVCLPDAPPDGPGLVDLPLEPALRSVGWRPPNRRDRDGTRLRVVLEDSSGEAVRYDQPVGAAFADRTFAPRRTRTAFLTVGIDVEIIEGD